LGVFALQNYENGPWRAEVGGRLEFHRLTAVADEAIGNPDLGRKFTAISGALGGSYGTARTLRVGLNLTYSQRVPSLDELFANGPHGGTQAFEVGNADFSKERSTSAELSLRKAAGPVTFGASAYHTRFANFIYQAPTGEIEDDLPVYQYLQGRARFTGFELEARAEAGTFGGVQVAFEGVADYVRAKVKGFGNAPQIPPLRLLGAVEGRRGAVDARFEVERNFAQRKIAPVETPTEGFTLVNASLNWRPLTNRPELSLGLSANNLLDVDARRHTSLLKDYAPLPGRDIRLTARFGF
jgi:iron complex outermembrane receptor protein